MIVFKLFSKLIGSIQTNVCKHTKDNGSKDIHGGHVILIIVLVKRCNIKFSRLSY